MALCAGLMLTGGAAFAASEVSAEPRDIPSIQADQDLATLLRKVEQQVSIGHAMSPASDSAMETWQRVLQIEHASRDSPKVLTALAGFAAEMRSRAAEEKKAGRLVVSSDLNVFADQATRLLGHSPATVTSPPPPAALSRTSPDSRTAGSEAVPTARDTAAFGSVASPVRPPLSPAPTDPRGSGSTTAQITVPGSAPVGPALTEPAAVAGDPVQDVADMAVARTTAAPAAPDQSAATFYAKRGDEMMAIKDITAARKFYEFAANAGNARAATALARTLDSEFAAQLGVLGLKADPVLAATWYRKAAALGDPEADARLRTLLSNEAAAK